MELRRRACVRISPEGSHDIAPDQHDSCDGNNPMRRPSQHYTAATSVAILHRDAIGIRLQALSIPVKTRMGSQSSGPVGRFLPGSRA